jgi:methionyl-tRNA formyltransferase
MDDGLDTGDIIKIVTVDVGIDEMSGSLFERLTVAASDLTIDILQNFTTYVPQKQNEALASHCKKITKQDGEVVFEDAEEIFNKYRAFTPWPGVYLASGLKLKEIKLLENKSQNKSGKILQIDKDAIVVGCKKGSVKISRVQPESKNEMDILSYINGKRLNLADTLS